NNIVLRAMVKSPEGRFQTAEDFRAALRSLKEPAGAPAAKAPLPFPAADPIPAPGSSRPAKGHRGLWIGLGAAAAIIAMILAATFLPRMFSTRADQKSAAVTTNAPAQPSSSNASAAQPAQPESTNPLATTAPDDMAGSASTTASVSAAASARPQPVYAAPAASQPAHPRVDSARPSAQTASAAPPPPAGPSPKEIAQARERMIQLGSQAEAARDGVQQIRSQQQAQGLDLRGDILASMNRMNAYLNDANRALEQNDLQIANDNMGRAEKELTTLNTFLGR
ncbi:MAG: hypothetical protein WBD10_11535, partial [Acidobacteriaceae bacterium]